jgi:hypothetical protein
MDKMETKVYYFKVIDSSKKRGYNKTISVYAIGDDFKPEYIGEKHINTASYRGDKPTAVNILSELYGYKTDGYMLLEDGINLYEI